MRMVGREREFPLLVEMLGRAEVGTGGFAVPTGEAGSARHALSRNGRQRPVVEGLSY
ncbi:MAG TPA: hypothetical protein VI030_12835 [Propionibacteriaceae bacterium]